MSDDLRTTFERATAGYDADYENKLATAILQTITNTSKVTDPEAIVMRTGEASGALLTCLAMMLGCVLIKSRWVTPT